MDGTVYRAALNGYRTVRRLQQRALNLIDPPVAVLLYHRVTKLPSDPELLTVSPDNFRDHLRFIKSSFRVVRLEDDWAALTGPAVAVTFDDGYADNVQEALPILADEGVPAAFFISTGNIGTTNEFWWYQMERILLHEAEFPASFTLRDGHYGGEWPTATLVQRRALYTTLNNLAQKIDMDRLERWLEQLRAWASHAGPGAATNRSLTEEEVKILAASPWATIGAHTVSHASLAALTDAQQQYEILASKDALERITGKRVEIFSYPFGNRRHYNRASIRLCRQAGFVKAASNFPGQVHRWTDPYQLPRHVVRNWKLDIFAKKMETFWAS